MLLAFYAKPGWWFRILHTLIKLASLFPKQMGAIRFAKGINA
jgi:hypothetical protein